MGEGKGVWRERKIHGGPDPFCFAGWVAMMAQGPLTSKPWKQYCSGRSRLPCRGNGFWRGDEGKGLNGFGPDEQQQ